MKSSPETAMSLSSASISLNSPQYAALRTGVAFPSEGATYRTVRVGKKEGRRESITPYLINGFSSGYRKFVPLGRKAGRDSERDDSFFHLRQTAEGIY